MSDSAHPQAGQAGSSGPASTGGGSSDLPGGPVVADGDVTQRAMPSPDSVTSAPAPPAWAASLSDLVIGTVDSVKAKSTVRVVTVLRLVVYGVVIIAALVTALLLLLVGVVRIWDVYIPIDPLSRRVWLGYVVFGGLLFLVGSWLLSRSRKAK